MHMTAIGYPILHILQFRYHVDFAMNWNILRDTGYVIAALCQHSSKAQNILQVKLYFSIEYCNKHNYILTSNVCIFSTILFKFPTLAYGKGPWTSLG